MPTDEKRRLFIVCNCSNYELIDRAEQRRYIDEAEDEGARIEIVADLCGALVDRGVEIAGLIRRHECVVVACHERALKGMLNSAGINMSRQSVEIVNLRKESLGRDAPFTD
ncbi:MAG: hypothetical protein ACOC6C_05710, partial [Verrucomicrobiota bacterium]